MLDIAFLFDANYLAPALVSVHSLLRVSEARTCNITLVYLPGDQTANGAVSGALQNFKDQAVASYGNVNLNLIELRGTVFSDYVQRYHFSSAILYKIILPTVFSHADHLLVLDCGMIFGDECNDFLKQLKLDIGKGVQTPVKAFCTPADGDTGMPVSLRAYSHNHQYPGAAVMYFDVQRYRDLALFDRLTGAYRRHREELLYAEQDLCCLTLEEGELSGFSDSWTRCHIDLANPLTWAKASEYDRFHEGGDYFYIKHTGSFKPWKKWVLNPAKAIYIRERALVAKLLAPQWAQLLKDENPFPDNPGFLAQQLNFLEEYYEARQ